MEDQKKNVTIIIIADNMLFAEMLKQSMQCCFEEEANVQTMNSSEVFFKALESKEIVPDAVVVDYELNRQEGEEQGCLEIIKRIKKISPELPIVVISEEKEMPQAAKTLQYGASAYVTKDKFAFSHITTTLKGLLNPSKL